MLKSNNGKPCGECSSKKRSGRCIHAAIVTTHVHTPGMEAEQDGGADGVECGPEEGPCGEDGSDGERGVERGSASYTQQSSPEVFARNMAQLRMVVAIYRFPVVEPEWKEGTYGRNRISIRGCNCTACGRPYNNLPDADATLLAHVCACLLVCLMIRSSSNVHTDYDGMSYRVTEHSMCWVDGRNVAVDGPCKRERLRLIFTRG